MQHFKIIFIVTVSLLHITNSCMNEDNTKDNQIKNKSNEKKIKDLESVNKNEEQKDNKYIKESIVDIQSLNSKIKIDLKYATTDNFMKIKLYNSINRAYLQKDVAKRLSACQEYLETINPNYSLLVYDAIRPVSVQQKMWDALDSIPPDERSKFVSNPQNRSNHNFGAAIDLTICDENNKPLDMGAGFDDIRKIAYPSYEDFYLKTGELKQSQLENRKLLRKVMKSQGFENITTEWWHFNACSRKDAIKKYSLLMYENQISTTNE